MDKSLYPTARFFNRYFSEKELAESGFFHPDEVAEKQAYVQDPLSRIDYDALRKLNLAREYAKVPFYLNCSFRSRMHELGKGRSGESAHTLGCAFDIRCTTDRDRMAIVSGALQAGFNRIGIAKTYIHLDSSSKHKQKVLWLY